MRWRLILGLAVSFIPLGTAVQSKPEFLETFTNQYKAYSAPIETRACANCHVSDSDLGLNPFGKQIQGEMKAEGVMQLSAAILQKIEALDSDGDGISNIDEIKAGTAPGDPKSVPARATAPVPTAPVRPVPVVVRPGPTAVRPAPAAVRPALPTAAVTRVPAPVAHPSQAPVVIPAAAAPEPSPAATSPTAPPSPAVAPSSAPGAVLSPVPAETASGASGASAAPPTSTPPASAGPAAAPLSTPPSVSDATAPAAEEKPLWPKNAFHPAIVHFPIALFLAGVFLDLLGIFRKSQTLLLAGWYNLVLAAVSSIIAIISGFAALMAMGVPFKGIIAQHMLMAVVSAFLMWIMVSLRVHQHEEMGKGVRILYYSLALVALILISWSGHLGGEFVYGS